MDVNGTRFHLLLGEADWTACTIEPRADAGWADDRRALTLAKTVYRFTAPVTEPLDLKARRGAARDRFGNWYWIDDDEQRVMVSSSGSGRTTTFWPVDDPDDGRAEPAAGSFRLRELAPVPRVRRLSGLAVTGHHRLVVGTVEPAGLLAFDLHAGGPPEQLLWPAATPFAPYDLDAAPDGGVWILDQANRKLWALDCHLKIDRRTRAAVAIDGDDFHNRDGSSRALPRQHVPLAPVALSAREPISIAVLDDGTVLVLDRTPDPTTPTAPSAVHRYRFDQQLGPPLPLAVMEALVDPADPALDLVAHDLAVVGSRLYVAGRGGAQAYAFDLRIEGDRLELVPIADYRPMRFFGGKALVAAGGRVFYDFGDGFIDLVRQPRDRHRHDATVTTGVLDGKEPGCVWHRLLVDAVIPGGAGVEVWSRAADERADLDEDRLPWRREPTMVRRAEGSELPFAPRLAPATEGAGCEGTWELLFQEARGRYAQVRLQLAGDGTTTPALRALRAYYPRFSYLEHYLPAVYRDDPASASFLDRFLALFEGFFTAIEDKIAAVQLLLDVRSAPADGLDWLADFFGVALDPAWDEARRRLFIRHAPTFFRWRGTIRGMQMALELAIARCPSVAIFDERRPSLYDSVRIIEKFRTRRTPGVVLGDPTDLDGIHAVPVTGRWAPQQGGLSLIEAWRAAWRAGRPAGNTEPEPATFPIRRPYRLVRAQHQDCDVIADDGPGDWTWPVWSAFCRRALGFVPSATDADQAAWADFLERAHDTVPALAQAWGRALLFSTFRQAPVPDALPPDGAELGDWYRFEGVLAVRRAAHRFVVALPVPASDTGNALEYQERKRLAERLVALEKPAHTVFEVKFYWAMFRVGEARAAIDTQIHHGSRAPDLLGPMVLGQNYLAEGYLAPRPPQDAHDRTIVGRDPIRG